MNYLRLTFICVICFLISVIWVNVFAQETITITTYYPSPYGSYRELRAQRMAIGDNYIDGSQYCWSPDTCTTTINADADLLVEGRVGIGTTSPVAKLEVRGGDFYAPDNSHNDCYWSTGVRHALGETWTVTCSNGYFVAGLQTTEPSAYDEWHYLYCCRL